MRQDKEPSGMAQALISLMLAVGALLWVLLVLGGCAGISADERGLWRMAQDAGMTPEKQTEFVRKGGW